MKQDRLSLLLIDDSFCDATLVKLGLERSGFLFDLCHKRDGLSALQYLENCEELPDVILLDLNLPKLSGKETLTLLRQSKQLRSLPVVVLTSSEFPGDIRSVYGLGAQAYFLKPIDIESYTRVLKQIIQFYPHYGVCKEDPHFIAKPQAGSSR